MLVNFLQYTEYESDGSIRKRFSWVTDLTITRDNARHLIRGGRARWKFENETFNTLMNPGYHFEHNCVAMVARPWDSRGKLVSPRFWRAWLPRVRRMITAEGKTDFSTARAACSCRRRAGMAVGPLHVSTKYVTATPSWHPQFGTGNQIDKGPIPRSCESFVHSQQLPKEPVV